MMVSAVSSHSPSSNPSAAEADGAVYVPQSAFSLSSSSCGVQPAARQSIPLQTGIYPSSRPAQQSQPLFIYNYTGHTQNRAATEPSDSSRIVELHSPSSPEVDVMEEDDESRFDIGEPPPLIKIRESPSDGDDVRSTPSLDSAHHTSSSEGHQPVMPAIPPPSFVTVVNPLIKMASPIGEHPPHPMAGGVGPQSLVQYRLVTTATSPDQMKAIGMAPLQPSPVPIPTRPVASTGQIFTVPYPYYTTGILPNTSSAQGVVEGSGQSAVVAAGTGGTWASIKPGAIPAQSSSLIQCFLPRHAGFATTIGTATNTGPRQDQSATYIANGPLQRSAASYDSKGLSSRHEALRVVHPAPTGDAHRLTSPYQQQQQQQSTRTFGHASVLSPEPESPSSKYYHSAAGEQSGSLHEAPMQTNAVPYYRLQGPYTVDDGVEDRVAHERQELVKPDPARITASVTGGADNDLSDSSSVTGGEKQTQDLYWCSQCHFTFKWRRHLEHHFAAHRTAERPNLCHLCGRCFTRGDHLNRHASMHFINKLTCQLCGETHQRASHLEMHWHNAHSNYLSNICLPAAQSAVAKPHSYSAAGRQGMAVHTASTSSHHHHHHHQQPHHHSQSVGYHRSASSSAAALSSQQMGHASNESSMVADDNQTDPSVSTSEELTPIEESAVKVAMRPVPSGDTRPFRCNTCARAFSRLAHLQRHQNVHTGDKPYRCSLCGRTYHTSDKLKAHVVMMHDSHLISCPTCKKEFSTMGALTNHQKVHIRERINSTMNG
eukprot:scpid56834/ scgid10071/ Zinc finger protein 431